MAASIQFYSGVSSIQNLSGSGLAFFGDSGFGAAISVGAYQGHTYISNSSGSTEGEESWNVKFLNAGSGIVGQASSGIALTAIPNSQATLNARFTYDSAVQVTSCEFRAYDRSDINNAPSGLTFKVAEIIHPGTTQANSGSGDTTWYTPYGSGVTVPLANSPGVSGLYAGNGSDSTRPDTQHDWYFVVSVSPDSIGAKTQAAGYLSCEYL